MTRGVPTAGFRRTRNKVTGELEIPKDRQVALKSNIDNVVPFRARGRDAINIIERKEDNRNITEVRMQFDLGLNDSKNPYSMEHTLHINENKVDFVSRSVTSADAIKPMTFEHIK